MNFPVYEALEDEIMEEVDFLEQGGGMDDPEHWLESVFIVAQGLRAPEMSHLPLSEEEQANHGFFWILASMWPNF